MPRAKVSPNRGKMKISGGITKIDEELGNKNEQPNRSKGEKNTPDFVPVSSSSAVGPDGNKGKLEADTCTKSLTKKGKRRKKGDEEDEAESVEKRFLCSQCGFRTATLTGLKNHENTSHPNPKKATQKEDKPFKRYLCATCGYQTNVSTNYKKHLKRHEPRPVIRRKRGPRKCESCQIILHPDSWKVHLRSRGHYVRTNNLNENIIIGKLNCPECDAVLRHMKDLDSHLEAEHGYKLESEQLSFTSMEEIRSWLESLLTKNQRYIKISGGTSRGFYCHRNGKYKAKVSSTTRKRACKKVGSVKSGKACPSRVNITQREGVYTVTHYKTHVGHDMDPTRIPIPLAYKEQIASDLVSGMPKAEVMSKYRLQFETEGIRPLNYNDLYNISLKFGLSEILKELRDAPNLESNPSAPDTDDDDNNSFWELTAEDLVNEDESPHPDSRVLNKNPPDPSSQLAGLPHQLNELLQLVQSREDAELVVNLLASPFRAAMDQLRSKYQKGAAN